MGACSFVSRGSGKTMKKAYQDLCESAIDFYGYQEGYNGTISTTGGYSDVTSRFKNSGKSLDDFISDRLDIIRKRDCEAICIEEPRGNTNKVKSQVKNIVTSGTKKWILKYVVLDAKGVTIGSNTTKGDAIKLARKYTEETQIETYIEMVKVLEKSSPKVAEIKYKKSTNERPGKYIFFGWAAE